MCFYVYEVPTPYISIFYTCGLCYQNQKISSVIPVRTSFTRQTFFPRIPSLLFWHTPLVSILHLIATNSNKRGRFLSKAFLQTLSAFPVSLRGWYFFPQWYNHHFGWDLTDSSSYFLLLQSTDVYFSGQLAWQDLNTASSLSLEDRSPLSAF